MVNLSRGSVPLLPLMPITTGQPSWTGATGSGFSLNPDDDLEPQQWPGHDNPIFEVKDGRVDPDFNRTQGKVAPSYQYKTAHDDLRDTIFGSCSGSWPEVNERLQHSLSESDVLDDSILAPSTKQVGLDLGLANKPSGVWTNGINGQGVVTSGMAVDSSAASNPMGLELNSMTPALMQTAFDWS